MNFYEFETIKVVRETGQEIVERTTFPDTEVKDGETITLDGVGFTAHDRVARERDRVVVVAADLRRVHGLGHGGVDRFAEGFAVEEDQCVGAEDQVVGIPFRDAERLAFGVDLAEAPRTEFHGFEFGGVAGCDLEFFEDLAEEFDATGRLGGKDDGRQRHGGEP